MAVVRLALSQPRGIFHGPLVSAPDKTAGLLGGTNLGQEFDYASACIVCGAGAQPVPPILADLVRMGTKQLDVTAHDGLIIVARDLAERLEQPVSRASNLCLFAVALRKHRTTHLGIWPFPMSGLR
jgi:hypothetical protein